jgi:hypothetical protein
MKERKLKASLYPNNTPIIFYNRWREWEFLGSIFVVGMFAGLILRIIYLAERKQKKFSRVSTIYVAGYCYTFCKYRHGNWRVPNHWSTTSILFLWWFRTLGFHNFVVYIPKNGCQQSKRMVVF